MTATPAPTTSRSPRSMTRRMATATISIVGLVLAAACSAAGDNSSPPTTPSGAPAPGTTSALQPDGRLLAPAGSLVALGNYPTGAAVSDDGRWLWTVSAGIGVNDVRIVDTTSGRVCQVIDVPGASGGVAVDSVHHKAYVSGLPLSRWLPSMKDLPGVTGDVVLAYSWTDTCGQATLDRTIAVPPQKNAPIVQAYPPARAGNAGQALSWPQKLAVSPDGATLVVPLNLANSAAIVDVATSTVRYVATGSYPFGAAVAAGSTLGVVTNEAAGTLSLIDLASATKVADVAVGAPLSHPQGVVIDTSGRTAYVALSASDEVVVVDLAGRKVERTISVGHPQGLGTKPVSLALTRDGTRLVVAESGADELSVIALPGAIEDAADWTVIGRIPTAAQPQAVVTTSAQGATPARVLYVAAEGMGIGANPKGTNPTISGDPIFWAFTSVAPTTDIFDGYQYGAEMVTGQAGILPLPSEAELATMTTDAAAQLTPSNATTAPADTVLRADGPIKHVFFLVRENRSYDQLLGDVAAGNGDPTLTVFGAASTPNLHSLVSRFPLLDNTYANSEASIQGHYLTAAANIPDYVSRNWVAQYAGRGRPNDFGTYAVSWPGNGFLFTQAEKQSISYFNYGEGFVGGYSGVADRDRTPALAAQITAVEAHSDLGPPMTGCYPSDMWIGRVQNNPANEIFDSSLPAGAPPGSFSHVDCFRQRFAQQVASGTVPTLSYLSLTSDHTRGTQPGFPTPTAMVADSDQAIGQILDAISHSTIWSSSAVFIVEDDSQDGADHVNAHRIPVAVVSPYAKKGAVVHTRYDLLSVVRSVELITGIRTLSLGDALAVPMYDAFAPTPVNSDPVDAIPATVDLLERNTSASPDAEWSSSLALYSPDQVSQAALDQILWHSVRGSGTPAPPVGPGASGKDDESEAETAAEGATTSP